MNCPYCNREIPDKAKFCSFCGEAIVQKTICPKCGADLPDCSQYCLECGAKIHSDSITPQLKPVQRSSQEPMQPHLRESSFAPISITINYQTGKSAFGTNTIGKLSVSSSGVEFTSSFSLSSKQVNHSYRFDQIRSTEFKMTRAGISPLFGYRVTLKDGTLHQYVYSPVQKSKLQEIDAVIKSKIS